MGCGLKVDWKEDRGVRQDVCARKLKANLCAKKRFEGWRVSNVEQPWRPSVSIVTAQEYCNESAIVGVHGLHLWLVLDAREGNRLTLGIIHNSNFIMCCNLCQYYSLDLVKFIICELK